MDLRGSWQGDPNVRSTYKAMVLTDAGSECTKVILSMIHGFLKHLQTKHLVMAVAPWHVP